MSEKKERKASVSEPEAQGTQQEKRENTAQTAPSPSEDTPGKKRRTKAAVISAAVLAAILVPVCALGAYVRQYDGVFPNTYVGDIALGGCTAEEALKLLNDRYFPEKIRDLTIPLVCRESLSELPVNDLEVEYCNKETVANAMEPGTQGNLLVKTLSFAKHLLSRTQVEPVVSYHSTALAQALDAIAAPYEVEPVGHTFTIEEGKVTIFGQVDGIKAERQPAVEEIEKQLREMQFSRVVLEPKDTAPEPLDFDEFYAWLTGAAQNAYYTKDDSGKVTVHPEKLQCAVEKEAVKTALEQVEASAENKAELAVTTTPPEITSAFLQEVLYKDKLSGYSTNYSGSAARVNNVQLASGRINGIELMPGEEFSYDKTILPRTAENGYRAAPVYVGNKVESGMGGGICQPSSTLYAAALYANLEILERHNHTLKVGYMPPGLDATIAQGYLDLRFKNNTGYPVKITADTSGGVVNFSIWGYNPENYSVELLRSGGGNSYHVTRVVKKDGAEVAREKMTSSHYQTPAPSETPKPTAKPQASQAPAATAASKPQTPAETAAPKPTAKPAATPAPTAAPKAQESSSAGAEAAPDA